MSMISKQHAQWLADHILPHEPALRTWLGRRMRNACDIDDVIQESWAQLADRKDALQIRDPRAYLFTVARSVMLQRLRRARIVSIESMAEIERLGVADSQPSPERRAVAHEELRQIGALIAALPNKCRQAFILRKVHGLSQREVAARMGVSENTVEKHIGKALRRLIAVIGRDPGAVREMKSAKDIRSGSRHEQTKR